MYINKVISYLGGWEKLRLEHLTEYHTIESVISEFNNENLRNPEFINYPYLRESNGEKIELASFMHAFDNQLRKSGWDRFRLRPSGKGGLSLFARNLCSGVSAKLLLNSRMQQLPNWILVEVPRLYQSGVANVSVLLVPDESVAELTNNRAFPLLTIESCLAQLEDLSPMKGEAPFVILGFSAQQQLLPLEVFEIESENVVDTDNIIEKCIEFAPEHYQAGVGILSYFGEVLKSKHPESKAKVRIEQDGSYVRLHIESKNGDREVIEKTLDEYALVVANKVSPSQLFDNEMQVMALSHKLEMAKMEVRQTQNMLQLSEKMFGEKVTSLEQEVTYMRNQLAEQLQASSGDRKLIGKLTLKQGEFIENHIIQQDKLIDSLIDQACYQTEVVKALTSIKAKLENGVTSEDEHDFQREVKVVANQAPELMDSLGEVIKNSVYGVTGNIAYDWFLRFSTMFP